DLIYPYPVFLSQRNKPQICVELQLAVFLCRLSSTRSLFAVSSQFEIGEGTVILYIKRVIQAIVIQKETFVKWSTLEECKKVHKGFEDLGGLKNIIKAVDRTHILMKMFQTKIQKFILLEKNVMLFIVKVF
ncbi:17740_t:CDS:1, partial [Funneliformis geosporum]